MYSEHDAARLARDQECSHQRVSGPRLVDPSEIFEPRIRGRKGEYIEASAGEEGTGGEASGFATEAHDAGEAIERRNLRDRER